MRLMQIPMILISLLLILTIFIDPVFADEVKINTNNLNVRSSPSIDSEIVDQVQAGETYLILQIQHDWVQIQLSDEIGWVSTDYVTVNKENKEEKTPIITQEKIITTTYENIHMRSGPSSKDPIISYIEKGTKLTVIKEDNHWYRVNHNGEIGYIFHKIIDNKQPTLGLYNKVITIDAGHGGLDVGSISSSGIYEKDLTIHTAIKLQQKLTALGAKVILTRTNDDYIRLGSRTTLANISNTDVFISIHYNSFPEMPTVTGIETYYYQNNNKQLAHLVQQELIKETSANDRQTTHADYQVLRQTNKPAILVELGFISNQENEQLLLTNIYQEKLINGITSGLNKYFLGY